MCYKFTCCDCYTPCCCCCCTKAVTCVYEGEVGVVEQYQKFQRVENAGEVLLKVPCGPCLPFLNESLAQRLPLRVQELPVTAKVKSKDNVFLSIEVRVLYDIEKNSPEAAYAAAYKLTDLRSQVTDYVEDVLRSFVATMDLDTIFTSTKDISAAVFDNIAERLSDFGLGLRATLVTRVDPDPTVRDSMNDINAQRRYKAAAVFNAEAEKAVDIKNAEAEAECRYLQGVGLAKARKVVLEGLADTIDNIDLFDATNNQNDDVTSLLLVTQYMDTLESIAKDHHAQQQGAQLFLPVGVDVLSTMKHRLQLFLNTTTPKTDNNK